MKKQLVLLVCSGTVLVLFCILFYLIYSYDPEKKPQDNTLRSEQDTLWNLDTEEIERITVSGTDGEYILLKQNDGWTVEGYESSDLMQDKLVYSVNAIAFPYGRCIADTAENMQDYGLDQPGTRIMIRSSEGELTLCLGNQAPSSAGIYGMKEGEDQIWLLTNSFFTDVPNTPLEYISLEVIPELAADPTSEEARNPEWLLWSGAEREVPVKLAFGEESGTYELLEPSQRSLPYNKELDEMIASIYNLTAESVAAYDAESEEYEKYGLAEGYSSMELGWRDTGGREEQCKLTLSKPENGYCYLCRDDSDIIWRVKEDAVPWYDLQYEDLFTTLIFLPDIGELSKIIVSGSGRQEEYLIDAEMDHYVTGDGESVDSDRFKKLYQTLIGLPAEEYTQTRPDEEAEVFLTVTYQYTDGRPDDVMELVEGEPLRMYMRLNGEAEFTTRKSYLDILLWNVDHLLSNGELKFFY